MSSSTPLSRSRSLRKPAAPLGDLGDSQQKDVAPPPASPSRLPMIKPPSASTRPSAISTTTATSGRPLSGVFGRSNTVAVRKPPSRSPEPPATQPVKNGARTATTRPSSNSISGPARPVPPSSRPITASGLPSTSTSTTASKLRSTAHARAKSSATALTSATVLRPPRPPSAASTTTTSTSTTATTTSKPSSGLTRANTISQPHRRQPTTTASAAPPTSSTITKPPSKLSLATTDDAAPRLRPAFNTLQQHYSPARNLAPKPSTASFLAPPSPSKLPANVAISAETARLQTELLQLHLLHGGSGTAAAQWRASAKERLGGRFAEIARQNTALGREEADVVERSNAAALRAWGGAELEGKIQALDAVLSGVWGLGEPGGKYARVVRRFEKWVERMVDVVEARRQGGGLGVLDAGDEIVFVGELDSAWKDECAVLVRKLDGWRRQLRELGDVSEGQVQHKGDVADSEVAEQPSLARILSGCRSQVHDMLAELNIMEQIERDAIRQETDWIRKMNNDDTNDDQKAGAIWRAF